MDKLIPFVKLSLLHAGYAKLNNDWNYSDVISPFVRLFLVTEGSASANFINQTLDLKAGYMYLIPSYVYNNYSCANYHEQYYVGFFEEVTLGMSIFNIKQFNYEVKALEYDYELFKRLLHIHPDKKVTDSTPKPHVDSKLLKFRAIDNASLSDDIETQGILTILLARFIKNTNVFDNNKSSKGDLNKVLVYIAKHLQEPLTINFLANYCNLSPDHFTRSFRAKFGIIPSKYIQVKRIERAQFLLVTTEYSLEKIAANVGLPNMSYFSRKFKEIVGVSPGVFRKRQLNLVANG
ncbi:hypothetical protein MHTCC0001_23830 [Flavobacteriaceae bacterium MHTCC 0001]